MEERISRYGISGVRRCKIFFMKSCCKSAKIYVSFLNTARGSETANISMCSKVSRPDLCW